jgi:hypothetical protein
MNTETLKAELTKIYTSGGSYVLAKANGAEKRARKAGLTHEQVRDVAMAVRIELNVGPRGEKNHPPLYG